MSTIRRWIVGGLVVAMGVAGIAVAKAGCTKGCRYFEAAVGEITFNGITKDYCMVFDDSGRGGFVYGTVPSVLVNDDFNCEMDPCVVYKEFDCNSDCVRIAPYVVGVPPQYEIKLGDTSVWRYPCIEGSDE